MKTGIVSIASFASNAEERRFRRHCQERTTAALLRMENVLSEDGELRNARMLTAVREVLKDRGIVPNTLGELRG